MDGETDKQTDTERQHESR